MEFDPVESSNIDGVCYQPEFAALFVRFKNGKIWQYICVPMSVHDEFMESESKGAFFAKHIKPKYAGGEWREDVDNTEGEYDTPASVENKAKAAKKVGEKFKASIRTGTIDL